jgi:quinol monooxygenase YgiN
LGLSVEIVYNVRENKDKVTMILPNNNLGVIIMNKFGMYVKFTAKSGQRDALVNMLLDGATSAQSVKECELYIVNVSDTEPDTVWVTEVWSNSEAHAASLTQEETKASIQRAMPLIAGVEATQIRPLGGKGL